MKKIIFIFILFNIISLNLFGKYKHEDFYKTVDLSKCKDAKEMLYTLKICHSVGEAMNNGTYLWRLAVEISHFVDYYYYMIGAYKYLINYYNTGDEYTKELMKDIYNVCSNFKLSGVSSYKEKKEYTSYEFAALLFNNSKEYTIDDYMSIINFGYKTNVLSREYLLNYLRDEDNFFLIGTHYYLYIFPITIEYKGKTRPRVTESLTEFYYDFYGTKFKVEKIIIKENDTWTDIYNKYGDTRITRGSDYRLVSEIENYKSKTSNYYERLNDITNTFNDKKNIILTNFDTYYTNKYYNDTVYSMYVVDGIMYNYGDICYKYKSQFDFMKRVIFNDLKNIEDGNYYNKFNEIENKISEHTSDIAKNIRSIQDKYGKYLEEINLKIEEIKEEIKKLEIEAEEIKKEALKKWLEYEVKNEKTRYLTIPEEFIGEYFYKVS